MEGGAGTSEMHVNNRTLAGRCIVLLLTCISDVPAPPSTFHVEEHPNDTRSTTVTWTRSVQSRPVYDVELDYIVGQRINGGEFLLI